MRQVYFHVPLSPRIGFSQVRLYRVIPATPGGNETYTPITSSEPLPAATIHPGSEEDVPAATPGLYISGKTLRTSRGNVLFTGTDPLSHEQAALQVSAQLPPLRAFSWKGRFHLKTAEVGATASFRIEDGEVAAAMGLPTNETLVGYDADVSLDPTVTAYTVRDAKGVAGDHYRYLPISDDPDLVFPASVTFLGYPPSATSVTQVYVDLVGGDGIPMVGQTALLYTEDAFSTAYQICPTTQEVRADAEGRVTFSVIPEGTYTLVIPGTSVHRRFRAPSSSVPINILDPSLQVENDRFSVAKPVFSPIVKRTL
jgi:hypothetical protein